VHGISVNSLEDMNLEFSLFHDISKSQKFGIRTHYLRSSKNYLDYVEEIGYLYDSSNYLMGDPKIYKNIVLFPLNVMDGKLIETKPFGVQRSNYDFIFNKTKKIISNAENNNQEYFTLLFHDRYFSDEFPVWKKWYIEIIKYLISEGHTFINFENATELLKMNKLKN